jgi:signal transduction histidine kinase
MEIRDYGCGISAENLKGLFINFSALAEHREANPSGRGIGLSICKSIVEQMGGTLRAESIIGQGTSFFATFQAMCHLWKFPSRNSSAPDFEESINN